MRVALVGGGPSALFVLKAILDRPIRDLKLDIFEASDRLGAGMPYSVVGANGEHVTNVSGNELPELVTSLADWFKTLPADSAATHGIGSDRLNDFKVVPRLLLGDYLRAQFDLLLERSERTGVTVRIRLSTKVSDIEDDPKIAETKLMTVDGARFAFDRVIICTGHVWPRTHEREQVGYFDSPYPPAKLTGRFNHRVALRGASLTAIDAVRTLARNHGEFLRSDSGKSSFQLNAGCEDFRIVMHTREGFLPGIRFHLDDSHLSKSGLLSEAALRKHMDANDGFVSLDYLFEHDFKATLQAKEPKFYEAVREMRLEEFVDAMMKERERSDAFSYFKQEYAEALQSIRSEESIHWKEKLAVLSFALNYPAKYFSAEDRLRLERALMPLISIVIAFTPQSSCEQLIALHDAGILDLVAIGNDAEIEMHPEGGIVYRYKLDSGEARSERFPLFIDCIGQRPMSFDQFPFPSLRKQGTVSPARLRFRSAESAVEQMKQGKRDVERASDGAYDLRVPGVAVTDDFNIVSATGDTIDRVYVMAVPLIAGSNPDYSGLDFCEAASKRIAKHLCK